MSPVPTPYADRIVAFIDILGFSALISRIGEDPALRKKIHRALTEIATDITTLQTWLKEFSDRKVPTA